MGIAALVLGIVSFVIAVTFVLAPLGVMLAVIGLILGIVDTVKKGKSGDKKAISITGMILCAVMFVALIVESFVIVLVGVTTFGIMNNLDPVEIGISEVESFNAKFDIYEGSNKIGSSVRVLLGSISSNNSYSEHYVDVYYNGLKEDVYTVRQKILSSKRYTVTFYKDIDGYINRVYILLNSTADNDEAIVNNEITNGFNQNDILKNTTTLY